MYERLAESLAERIESGEFDTDDPDERPKLPSENELLTRHGLDGVDHPISKSVVRQAIKALSERGLVETVPGAGSYITRVTRLILSMTHTEDLDRRAGHFAHYAKDAWSSDVLAAGHTPYQDFKLLKVVPSAEVAERLEIPVSEVVTVRQCWRKVDGKPSCVETSWFGAAVVAALPDLGDPRDIDRGTTVYLGEHYPGLDHLDEIGTEAPSGEEQEFLRLPAGVVFLVRDRLTFDRPGGKPLRLMRTVYRGDQYKFRYSVAGRGNVDAVLAGDAR